jgi:hypothetical protein
MNGDKHNVEWIVAEVLRRLEKLADAPAATQPPPTASLPPVSPPKPNNHRNATDLVVEGRVVSLATIGDRLPGKKRLVVSAVAVVTPSVRDELRKRGVQLQRTGDAVSTALPTISLLVVVSSSTPAAERLASQASQLGCESVECSDLQAAAAQFSEQLGRTDSTGIWLSEEPLVAACLANRDCQIRASVANDLTQVQAARSALGTNLVVVDPRRVTEFQWKQIVAELGRNLPNDCPQVLRPRM